MINIDIEGYTIYTTSTYPTLLGSLALSPKDALELMHSLEAKRAEITDLATNFYECRECGGVHRNSAKRCPTLGGSG